MSAKTGVCATSNSCLNASKPLLPCTLLFPFPFPLPFSIGEDRPYKLYCLVSIHFLPQRLTQSGTHTSIIDLSTTCIHRLQQLINLLITHLFSQIRQNIPKLPDANETRHLLVEDLKAAAVFFGFAGIAETTGAV